MKIKNPLGRINTDIGMIMRGSSALDLGFYEKSFRRSANRAGMTNIRIKNIGFRLTLKDNTNRFAVCVCGV